jgi:hypothetical protein
MINESKQLECNRRTFGWLMTGIGASALITGSRTAQATTGMRSAVVGKCTTLRTRFAAFEIDATGRLTKIFFQGRNYATYAAPLLSLRIAGAYHAPTSAQWNLERTQCALQYQKVGAIVQLAVCEKPTHITFELTKLKSARAIDLVLWGSYPTIIDETVGEMVGVVRDAKCAIGIQALNVKTEGGYPAEESDIESDEREADDPGNYPGLPEELKQMQRWRGDTARLTATGSDLQAYCRNRDSLRVIHNWGWDDFDAQPYNDGGVIGSKIALFAVPSSETLATISAIEIAEGLPHPMLDGVWAKQSIHATDAYLIADFSEASINRAIEMTKRTGLKYLYHSSPFETWGHFELKSDLFPHGWDGFKYCVNEGRKAGIRVGFHMLSNFITTNDAYVTPKPDPRLARVGTDKLITAIDSIQTEITVVKLDFFRKLSALNTVIIDDELIQYESVSSGMPLRLLKCKRGAFGTTATAHAAGKPISRLLDHGYKVFLTDTNLCIEVAHNLADFCNHTGAQQTSLDGLEGNWSTGMGQYGCSLFTKAWWDAMDPKIRPSFINDASMPHHFTWHIATRYNWGEPWNAGFRQSQTMMRLKYQIFYTRNLIPRMLGWFTIRKETTIADAEWLGARSAGFDAGFALAIRFESQAQQAAASSVAIEPEKLAILDAIKRWEAARQSEAFPASVKAALQDVTREFHLADVRPGEWELQPTNPPGPALRIKSKGISS